MTTCPSCHTPDTTGATFCGGCGQRLGSPSPRTLPSLADAPRTFVVGRDPSCDYILDRPSVSGRHCQLRFLGTQLEVTDLGSSNGTFVGHDKRRVAAPVVIAYGEPVFLGSFELTVADVARAVGVVWSAQPMQSVSRTVLEVPTAPVYAPPQAGAVWQSPPPAAPPVRYAAQPMMRSHPPKKPNGVVRQVIGVLVLVILLGWVGLSLVAGRNPLALLAGAVRGPQVVVDETMSLDEGEAKLFSISSPSTVNVHIEVSASPEAVDVMLMNDNDVERYKAANGNLFGGQYSFRQGLSSQGVTAFDQSDTLPEGKWTFVVQRPRVSALVTDKTDATVKITVQ